MAPGPFWKAPRGVPCPRGTGLWALPLRVGRPLPPAPSGPLLPLLLLLLVPGCAPGPPCGHRHPFRKIISGQNAPLHKWPWQVSLQVYDSHLCGGSLITTEWVLTAAHCILWNFDYTVKLGDVFFFNVGSGTFVSVRDILIHPSYSELISLQNDLALVRLNSSVNLSRTIQPVCLPDSKFYVKNGTRCWVTGWGRTKDQRDDSYPYVLQEADVFILERYYCHKILKKHLFFSMLIPYINEKMLCAFHPKGKDACQGDSGGPLVCEVGHHTWVQVGIVSWGIGCGKLGMPGVYTRVSSFSKWIIKTINKQRSSCGASSYTLFVSLLLPLYFLITM
ncbi:putative serine protease 45 [Sminthopsis crassicaudata]|uniref:putative serine protease 45 n=1 Tax=Sminthopsis crassicaudata TaxID=9301 RepID=UPI003D6807A1